MLVVSGLDVLQYVDIESHIHVVSSNEVTDIASSEVATDFTNKTHEKTFSLGPLSYTQILPVKQTFQQRNFTRGEGPRIYAWKPFLRGNQQRGYTFVPSTVNKLQIAPRIRQWREVSVTPRR